MSKAKFFHIVIHVTCYKLYHKYMQIVVQWLFIINQQTDDRI